jgi:glutamyl-tRNA synthetase
MYNMLMIVRTRIAPSPTGFAHIGTIYQVLFDYSFAKKHSGQFVVRIEDTDRSRFVEGAEDVIYQSLEWFGLNSDEDPKKGGQFGPYRQSERLETYKKYVDQLITQGDAYYCFCSKERLEKLRQDQQAKGLPTMYDKHCLALLEEEVKKNVESDIERVVRMKIPENQKITVKDEIVGEVEFDSNLIDHQVILKSDGYPTYHLAVVVDDYLMKITHIFRGTEWLPSTPKHVLLYKYFGWEDQIPQFIHLPLILNANGKGKLSKRDQSAGVEFYQKEGYLPEAVLNYLSNIVWNHPEGKEIYSLDEFIKLFEISDLQSKGARFDLAKLEWMNGEYIRSMSDDELTKRLQEFLIDHPAKERISEVVPLVKERMKKLSDFVPLTDFLWEAPEYEKQVFEKVVKDKAKIRPFIEETLKALEGMEKPWKADTFEKTFRDLASELGLSVSEMFQLIRVAISGQTVTPPLFESIEILGEEETIGRVRKVLPIL